MKFEEYLKLAEKFNPQNVIDNIAHLGRFHRIQGSKELAEAANFVFQTMRDMGIDTHFFVEYYDGESVAGNMNIPIAWEVEYGKVETEKRIITTEETKLVVMTHSPPGRARGEVIPIKSEEDWEKVKGKIVLVRENWRENYRRACKKGAKGYIAYRKGLKNAVPYIGLFLTRKDLEWAKIPAVAISESLAMELIRKTENGEKFSVRLEVKSKIKEKEILPIIYATIGKPPYILFSAHICHPRPGANDNASGSAMLIELARVLRDLHNENFRFGFAFLWVPEHIGTSVFIEKHAILDNYYGVINLDMVAGNKILFIRTPLSRFSLLSPVLELFLKLKNSETQDFAMDIPRLPLSATPYSVGSDHDIFNFFGVPAVMMITWPYPYYHSSEDSVDKLNKESIEIIGKAVLASSLFLSQKELKKFARASQLTYLGELSMKREVKVAEILVDAGLKRDGKFLGIEIGKEGKKNGWLRWTRKGMLTPEIIKEEKNRAKLQEIYHNRRNISLIHELIMLGEQLDESSAWQALWEEYGEYDMRKIRDALKILEKERVIEFT